jgi:hypothetical protein
MWLPRLKIHRPSHARLEARQAQPDVDEAPRNLHRKPGLVGVREEEGRSSPALSVRRVVRQIIRSQAKVSIPPSSARCTE